MPIQTREAWKARKLEIDLTDAKDRAPIAVRLVDVIILDKGTGSFELTFVFYDDTELTLSQAEVANGDDFRWDIRELLLTNPAQAAVTLKLLGGYPRPEQ